MNIWHLYHIFFWRFWDNILFVNLLEKILLWIKFCDAHYINISFTVNSKENHIVIILYYIIYNSIGENLTVSKVLWRSLSMPVLRSIQKKIALNIRGWFIFHFTSWWSNTAHLFSHTKRHKIFKHSHKSLRYVTVHYMINWLYYYFCTCKKSTPFKPTGE